MAAETEMDDAHFAWFLTNVLNKLVLLDEGKSGKICMFRFCTWGVYMVI